MNTFRSLAGAVALALSILAVPAQARTSLLVPAYFYPFPESNWEGVISSAVLLPVTAIINPDNGPGNALDRNFQQAITALHAAGGYAVGYVYTGYGSRPKADVLADIERYLAYYDVDGFFIDEMANTVGPLDYYRDIYGYIKSKSLALRVFGNPGTSTLEAYTSASDVLVTFEGTAAQYATFTPDSWVTNYPAERFAHLVTAQPTRDGMLLNLDQAHAQHADFVYVTDDAGNNPYDRLPAYWHDETQDAARLSAGATPQPSTESSSFSLLAVLLLGGAAGLRRRMRIKR